jgi:hypothetical protein
MRRISIEERRRLLVGRHHLRGDAASPDAVTTAVVALHATDPASVYLSVLARSRSSSLTDVSEAMYERRTLVRWMAMRRTLFLFPRSDIPMIQAAVSTPLAATLRASLISRLTRNGTVPPIDGDIRVWLTGLENRVEEVLHRRGTATGAQLGVEVPELRTRITPRAPSDLPQTVTSPLLTVMSTEARMVRGTPTGAWTSRHHRWEPLQTWWPEGLPTPPIDVARRDLARRWLARFGPATFDDLQWWTGWNKTALQSALKTLPIDQVDLHGEPGITLTNHDDDLDASRGDVDIEPAATLLPALDPTPMGWKDRDWFFAIDRHHVFDRAGNIGPTLWWNGEIIGSWAVSTSGEIRTAILADRGVAAETAVAVAAERLHDRLAGTTVVPAIRTPLERSLL